MDHKEIGRCDELANDRDHWRALVKVALNMQVTQVIELVNVAISRQLCSVTINTIWKNAGDGRTILR
jgi:hypothetical protein